MEQSVEWRSNLYVVLSTSERHLIKSYMEPFGEPPKEDESLTRLSNYFTLMHHATFYTTDNLVGDPIPLLRWRKAGVCNTTTFI